MTQVQKLKRWEELKKSAERVRVRHAAARIELLRHALKQIQKAARDEKQDWRGYIAQQVDASLRQDDELAVFREDRR